MGQQHGEKTHQRMPSRFAACEWPTCLPSPIVPAPVIAQELDDGAQHVGAVVELEVQEGACVVTLPLWQGLPLRQVLSYSRRVPLQLVPLGTFELPLLQHCLSDLGNLGPPLTPYQWLAVQSTLNGLQERMESKTHPHYDVALHALLLGLGDVSSSVSAS